MVTMNTSGQLSLEGGPLGSAARGKTSGGKRRPGRPRKVVTAAPAEDEGPARPAVGTLTRTKSLLNAALRVWELKQAGYG